MQSQQGVLWKRRDVFKNRWRPRWFILQPDQGILTYYLLTSSVNDTIAASPSRVETTNAMINPAPVVDSSRGRTTSFDSSITDNTINYDVIPRGTIFLLNCKVSVNEALTNVQERLFIFTIEPPNNKELKVHLAARSAPVRDAWIRQIARVCESLSAPQVPLAFVATPHIDANDTATTDTPVNSVVVENEPEDVTSNWTSADDPSDVFANVSDTIKTTVGRELATNLAICDQPTLDMTVWQKLYLRGDGSAAYQKRNSTQPMILTRNQLEQPVKQVFNLLVDPSRRQEFESNIRHCERLQVLSPHTFLDYYSYNAVWPSRPREFAVAVHWQILHKGDEKAIAIVAFSCDEASSLKPVQDSNVRATLFVNFTLLRQTGPNACHVTRILSYALGGGIPAALSNYIMAQQVGSSRAVGERLSRHEPVPSERLKGPLVRADIIHDVIQRIGTEMADASMRHRSQNDSDDDMSLVVSDPDAKGSLSPLPALMTQSTLLASPLLIYNAAIRFLVPFPAIWFIATVFLAVRQLVLQHFTSGAALRSQAGKEPLIAHVTCRFKVDLKGVLRFLANKKEERQPGSTDVSVLHIVARACAVALKKRHLHTRHLSVPCLMIDKYVLCRDESVSVSLILESDQPPVTLDMVDTKTVQEVADAVEKGRESPSDSELGPCLILASHNSDDCGIEADAIPLHPGVSLVAVIGSVALERPHVTPSGLASIPRPTLQLSLTISPPEGVTFSSARRLAEEVQKLILYPEISDDA